MWEEIMSVVLGMGAAVVCLLATGKCCIPAAAAAAAAVAAVVAAVSLLLLVSIVAFAALLRFSPLSGAPSGVTEVEALWGAPCYKLGRRKLQQQQQHQGVNRPASAAAEGTWGQ